MASKPCLANIVFASALLIQLGQQFVVENKPAPLQRTVMPLSPITSADFGGTIGRNCAKSELRWPQRLGRAGERPE